MNAPTPRYPNVSPVVAYLNHVAKAPEPHAALDAVLDRLSNIERAALLYDWEGFWARPNQLPPEGKWASWGGLTGRGWGKTRTMAEYVTREALSGRAMLIALGAQNEDKCIDVMVKGPSGLLAVSPPWGRAIFEGGRVVWPNGAQAFVYTPERPGNAFGPEHHLAWLSEIHAWPATTQMQFFSAIRMGLRLGYSRMVWDSNPKRKHPILRLLLARGERDPDRHIVFRGSTYDNRMNLNAEAIAEWERDYGGTQLGREMLEGEQFDESDGALFKQSWIDSARRQRPEHLQRTIIVIDPAISVRRGTDATGIVELALDYSGQLYVLDDMSDKLAWEEWGELVIDRYMRDRCDCIVVERNRGGDACAANIRACGKERGITVVVAPSDAKTMHVPGVVNVKEVIGRQSKGTRAQPVASVVERGRVSFVSPFDELEEQLTTFEDDKGLESPNAYDAFVWGVWELAGLAHTSVDQTAAARGVAEAQRQLAQATRTQNDVFGGGRRSMSRL